MAANAIKWKRDKDYGACVWGDGVCEIRTQTKRRKKFQKNLRGLIYHVWFVWLKPTLNTWWCTIMSVYMPSKTLFISSTYYIPWRHNPLTSSRPTAKIYWTILLLLTVWLETCDQIWIIPSLVSSWSSWRHCHCVRTYADWGLWANEKIKLRVVVDEFKRARATATLYDVSKTQTPIIISWHFMWFASSRTNIIIRGHFSVTLTLGISGIQSFYTNLTAK